MILRRSPSTLCAAASLTSRGFLLVTMPACFSVTVAESARRGDGSIPCYAMQIRHHRRRTRPRLITGGMGFHSPLNKVCHLASFSESCFTESDHLKLSFQRQTCTCTVQWVRVRVDGTTVVPKLCSLRLSFLRRRLVRNSLCSGLHCNIKAPSHIQKRICNGRHHFNLLLGQTPLPPIFIPTTEGSMTSSGPSSPPSSWASFTFSSRSSSSPSPPSSQHSLSGQSSASSASSPLPYPHPQPRIQVSSLLADPQTR